MFKLNPNFTFKTQAIANTSSTLWIVDDVMENFTDLVFYAKNTAYYQAPGMDNTLFPGMRDDMPAPYYQFLDSLLTELYSKIKSTHHSIARCWLSKITLKPSELSLFQTMPHYDSLLSEDMAAVHYLNDNLLGGTNFYRYRKTDKIEFSTSDEQLIRQMVADHQDSQETNNYINHSTSVFEKIATVPAKKNRMILYSGNILHSAAITNDVNFEKHDDNNRTSVNCFFKLLR